MAEKGCSEAQYQCGSMYSFGWGIEQNYKKAFEWYEKAAEQGDVEAQTFLDEILY